MPISLAAVVPHPPILVAEIGKGRERAAQATLDAYAQISARLLADPPDHLLMISTHGIVTLNRFHLLRAALTGSLEQFGCDQCRIEQPNDALLSAAIYRSTSRRPLMPVKQWEPHDHSMVVPLTLLREALAETPTTVVSICFRSTQEHRELGRAIADGIANTRGTTAVIASGDGVHTLTPESPQGYHPKAAGFQRQFDAALAAWDIDTILAFDSQVRREVDESVVAPTAMLGGILQDHQVSPELLSAESPWGVAYTTALLNVEAAG